MGANLCETTRSHAPFPRKRRFATLKKPSPGGSEVTPAARVMVSKALAAETEARQLASCVEGTSSTATRCGASPFAKLRGIAIRQTRGRGAIWSSGWKRANRADSGAPRQTLGTPRASASAGQSAPSEGPRAPPDCDPRAGAGSRVGDGVTHTLILDSSLENDGSS